MFSSDGSKELMKRGVKVNKLVSVIVGLYQLVGSNWQFEIGTHKSEYSRFVWPGAVRPARNRCSSMAGQGQNEQSHETPVVARKSHNEDIHRNRSRAKPHFFSHLIARRSDGLR